MISNSIPKNASCILIGSGLGFKNEKALSDFENWFLQAKNPACVIDADIFYYESFPLLLTHFNSLENARIILTPHPKELKQIYEKLFPEETLLTVAEISDKRIEIGKKISAKFPRVTVVMKSANTFIADKGEIFICNNGCQSLSKGGSGDVLAGMCAALLAQGYTARDAALTAVYCHGAASYEFSSGEGYDLTPEKLIAKIGLNKDK